MAFAAAVVCVLMRRLVRPQSKAHRLYRTSPPPTAQPTLKLAERLRAELCVDSHRREEQRRRHLVPRLGERQTPGERDRGTFT